jgi:hypothetical protein
VWKDNLGADNRIYFINEIDDEFDEFYRNPLIRQALRDYTGIENPAGMLLAARLDAKDGNVGSGGGWHRDSPTTHQFKAVCYLNDVNTHNGPFQYIKSSHHKLKVIAFYFRKLLKAGSYRFSDEEISDYIKATDQNVIEVTGSEGSLAFVDTKAIHRGKPIEKGSRYVLFCYFWAHNVPKHFEDLRQNK